MTLNNMKTKNLLITLIISTSVLTTPALGQSLLGHEYELKAAPIRKDEKPVIPLDAGDPSSIPGASYAT